MNWDTRGYKPPQEFPPQEEEGMVLVTDFQNALKDRSETHKLPEFSELYRSTLVDLATAFQKVGVNDWAVAGSMQKIIAGVQDVKDVPGDIDVVTTKVGVNKIWDLYKKGGLDFGGKATFSEPKEFDANEKYGKSTVLSIKIEDTVLGTIDLDIFGEGDKDGGTYGGSVQLGNMDRHAEIWKVEGGVQILSERDQRRQYMLVLCSEMRGEAIGEREKIASRMVSLLQYAEDNPEQLINDLNVLDKQYKHLPQYLHHNVSNIRTLLENHHHFAAFARERLGGDFDEHNSLNEMEVLQTVETMKQHLSGGEIAPEVLNDLTAYVARIDYKAITDKKVLRDVFETLYDMAKYVGDTFKDIPDAEEPEKLHKRTFRPEKEAFLRALDAISIRSGQYRGWHAEFLRVKLAHLDFNE